MSSALVPSELKVAELRQELSARGLSTKGVKKVLAERLTEALENDNTGSGTDNNDGGCGDDGDGENKIELLPEEEKSEVDMVPFLHDGEDAGLAEYTNNAEVNLESTMGQANSMDVDNETNRKAEENIGMDITGEDMHRKRKLSDSDVVGAAVAEQADNEIDGTPDATVPTQDATHATEGEDKSEIDASITDSLYIKNLERPLTVFKMRELLGKYGATKDIWLNSIKTRAYVHFDSKETAAAAFDGINGTKFPPEYGKTLECGVITHRRMKELVETEVSMIEAVHNMDLIEAPAGDGNCGIDLVNTKGRGVGKRAKAEKAPGAKVGDIRQTEKISGGQSVSLVVAATSAAAEEAKRAAKAVRVDERLHGSEHRAGEGDMTRIEADALTRRTKVQPAITFRPLTDEQVAAKKAATGRV
ncbi:hypothetical protein H4S08_004114 [Coemansia sp. RSA 1365]|nr:hypothetical protein H4S08_004114 [Coemansia sp. RSA 1365]